MDDAVTWQTLLAKGWAAEALKQYRLETSLDGSADADTLDTLRTLASVQTDLREKAYARALRRVQASEVPQGGADWATLAGELSTLASAAEAFDRREPDKGLEDLDTISSPLLRAEVETLLGTASVLDNDVAGAQAHFEQALTHDPGHYRAMTNLGNLALEAGRVDDAIDHYERSLKLNDDFANAHHNLGVAYRRKGEIGKSVRALRKAQSSTQKQMREEARENLRRGSRGQWAKYGRWLLYALSALIVYFVLRSRGVL